MKKQSKKNLIIAIISIATIILIIIALINNSKNSQLLNKEDLSTTIVETKNIEKVIATSGEVKAKTERIVTPDSNGRIKEIKVSQNDKVEKDQVLAAIETINSRGTTIETDIKSPIGGTVTKINTYTDQYAIANQSQLFQITDLSDLTISASVVEADISKVKKEQLVHLEFPAIEGLTVEGKINQISLVPIDQMQGTTSYSIGIELNQIPQELMIGMSSNIEIVTDIRENVLSVNDIYIYKKDEKNYVKIYRENTNGEIEIIDSEVEIGIRGETELEIISGVEEGNELLLPTEEYTNDGFNSRFFNRE